MAKKPKNAISPTREENYAEWYQQVVRAADLAENSPVRGCMIIKPWGYALWENIQKVLDGMFKATGHENAYFPLLIPLSFLEKEAEHVDGFAKECAVVTHHRLEAGADGKLVPAGPLEEPLVIRPTSETIIGDAFARWIKSYRDLPLLINQWANVMRWEMRTRLFLRTSEFLWQEGHTAHATSEEALEETMQMVNIYAQFAEEYAAMPVLRGEKTASERFPGAVQTLCIEAMMQDRKALQSGTSHFLGQNFSKAAKIRFSDPDGNLEHAWTTSWGVSTRLIGGILMTHSDDDGLRLPPRLAPLHVVILPVLHKPEVRDEVLAYCESLASELRNVTYDGAPVRVKIDKRELPGGEKSWSWVKRGVPLRVEVGPRDIANNGAFVGRRDTGKKGPMERDALVSGIADLLTEMQAGMLAQAMAFREEHTQIIDSKDEFYAYFTPPETKPNAPVPAHAGFALTHFSGDEAVEEQIKKDLSVTVRSIPFGDDEPGTCPFSGKPSLKRVVWAKSY